LTSEEPALETRPIGEASFVAHFAKISVGVARFALVALSWVVVAALAILSVFHFAHSEPYTLILSLIAVTPWIYMLAWASAVVGLLGRRLALAAISVMLVGLQLWWVVPDFDPISHLVRLPKGADEVRLLDANVYWGNFNLSGIADEIRAERSQLVTLEEPNGAALAQLARTGVLARFRYRLVDATGGSDGMAMYSVFPLLGATVWHAGPHLEFQASLQLPGGRRLRVDVIQVTAPVGGPELQAWEAQMNAIREELAHEPRPLVAVGNFNATWYDWHFQALLHDGLRDAAVVAGQGWRMNWPGDQAPVLPYMRIDHILISPTVSLERYGVGQGKGSNHRSLFATVSVGGRPSRA
jgi:endonuclease/exonuclease/phosphatase (EEP) superfamily protein YafD